MKFQNDFNKQNTFKFNIGKIMKEPIINFTKESKIILAIKINEQDIHKEIYFLQNFNKNEKKKYDNHIINLNNFVILINDNIYESKNYFIPKESGIYHIKIFIKNIVQDCFGLFYECRKITKINLFFFDTKNVTALKHVLIPPKMQ